MASYFKILGIGRNASATEATHRWKQLMAIHHPNKNPDNVEAATERSQLINNAHERVKVMLESPWTYSESAPFPESDYEADAPLETPDELNFYSFSLLCDDYISTISTVGGRASKLLQSYRKDRARKKAQIYYMSQIKSKTSGFMTSATTWRTWLNNRHERAIGPKAWWYGLAVLEGLHADLSAKFTVVVELSHRLEDLVIEDPNHILSDDDWQWQVFRVREVAAWVSTLEVR